MSFGFSATKDKSIDSNISTSSGEYGLPNPMVAGLGATRQQHAAISHPLEASEKNHHENRLRMEMIMLRNTQGLHAPMRMAMELKAADRVGRLPFLHSTNVMRDVILGRDEEIGFEDILNIPEFQEQMGRPHAVIEKSLGIL